MFNREKRKFDYFDTLLTYENVFSSLNTLQQVLKRRSTSEALI